MTTITLRRHFFFDPTTRDQLPRGLTSADDWDVLRTSRAPGFWLPQDRAAWITRCAENQALAARARTVLDVTRELGLNAVASFGVGLGCLEREMKQTAPGLTLTVSDYSSATVDRLKLVFNEADQIDQVDLLAPQTFRVPPDALVLLHRIDSEFDHVRWRQVFDNLAPLKAPVLVFPTALLSLGELTKELGRRAVSRISTRRATFVGYIRSHRAFVQSWQPTFRTLRSASSDGLDYFLLVPR